MIHVVEPGEILKDIAARFATTVAAILAVNPDIEDPELIFPGQKITIPTSGVIAPVEPDEPVEAASSEYLVRSGDTMTKIARHFGVRVARLIAANPQVPDPDVIRPGQALTIPGVAMEGGRARGGVASVTKPTASGLAGWLAVAKREMDTGVDETQGRADNPRIVEYHKTTTIPAGLAAQDETPWCSSFVNWCILQAGLKGTGSATARSWLNWGKDVDRPERGAVTVFRRDGGPTLGHVGFYWAKSGDRVLVLGGNQDNQVSIKGYPKADLLGHRWPD